MPGDDFGGNLAFPRCQAVRREEQADQLITACRLDADRNLIFVAADERAGLQNGPLATSISQSGSESVRAGGASAYAMTCIITKNRPGAI
jgi:hypothetical protein